MLPADVISAGPGEAADLLRAASKRSQSDKRKKAQESGVRGPPDTSRSGVDGLGPEGSGASARNLAGNGASFGARLTEDTFSLHVEGVAS